MCIFSGLSVVVVFVFVFLLFFHVFCKSMGKLWQDKSNVIFHILHSKVNEQTNAINLTPK